MSIKKDTMIELINNLLINMTELLEAPFALRCYWASITTALPPASLHFITAAINMMGMLNLKLSRRRAKSLTSSLEMQYKVRRHFGRVSLFKDAKRREKHILHFINNRRFHIGRAA